MSNTPMMSNLMILVPTRGRPDNLQRLTDSFDENSNSLKSSLMPIMDRFEATQYPGVGYLKCKPDQNLVQKLNFGAKWALQAGFKYVAFLGDDVVIHTKDFDLMIDEEFRQNKGTKIIHCADKLHNGAIANHWVIRADVIQAVGFFALPVCKHMFIDNFWTEIGRATGSIKYMDNILWEHRHFINKKEAFDDTYKRTNTDETFKHDETAYKQFLASAAYINFLTVYNNV